MGGLRLYQPAGRALGGIAGGAGFHSGEGIALPQADTRGTFEEPHEVPSSGEGGIPVRHHQAAVCGLCAEQLGDGERGAFETKSAETAGYVRLKNGNGGITPAFSGLSQ